MDILSQFLNNFIDLALDTSPWLLAGLVIAGMLNAWISTSVLTKHLGKGKTAIVKAAIIGAPLPLCSCSVIPVATELRRGGASVPATSAFLVSTPETGVDSISVSYALLGPLMAVYRPITAILSAIITGLLVSTTKEQVSAAQTSTKTCCTSQTNEVPTETKSSCCASKTQDKQTGVIHRSLNGLRYAATQLIDDLIIWLVIGLIFASLVKTFVPHSLLLAYGSGLPAMLIMIVISIPMYICATASTPIAAGLIAAGISPGTALVFMMAGPATNISTLGVIKNEMGAHVLSRYLLGIVCCAIFFGLALDWGIAFFALDFNQQIQQEHQMLPLWLSISCLLIISVFAIKPLRRLIMT